MRFSMKKKKKSKDSNSDDEVSVDQTEPSKYQEPPKSPGGFMYKFRESNSLSRFKRKKESEIKDLQAKVDKRKWSFGDEYLTLAEKGASRSELDSCVKKAQEDVKEMEVQIEKKKVEIEEKTKETEAKIQAAKEAKEAAKLAKASRRSTVAETADAPLPTLEGDGKKKKKKKKLRGAGSDDSCDDSSDGNVSLDEDVEEADKRKKKKRKPRKSTSIGAAATAASASAKNKSRPSHVPTGWKNTFNKQTRNDEPDPKRWNCEGFNFDGKAMYMTRGIQQSWQGPIEESVDKFKRAPEKYVALMFQADMLEWSDDEQECTVVYRENTVNWKPEGIHDGGWMKGLVQEYERCRPFPDNEFPMDCRDKYTDDFTFKGKKIHSGNLKPVMPGRGMGVGDAPNLKVIGDIDPSDIFQGGVGDCWLLSGISALAEFDGAIKKLFRKTKDVLNMPTDEANLYTITLWDLETWEEVDITIDERLCAHPDGMQQLLGSKPSEDGELWAPYIEKAVAAHAGGWDKIVGGQCTHAWALLTGCKEQYTITKSGGTDEYMCAGRFNAQEKRWLNHGNSPHDGEPGLWPMPWPEVGGGGDGNISRDRLFLKMVAWDKANYIVGAGTKGDSDSNSTEGMVDNHAYTVIATINDVAGTGIDMMKVRNPWGKGEIENGRFDDDGPGWDEFPQIKKLLKPVVADDGIFWVTKEEFFEFFETIYVSASDMTTFLEDTDHQYD